MPDTPKPRIDPTITFGALLQLAGMTVLGLGFLFYLRGDVNSAAKDLRNIELQMAAQASGTREMIREGMSRVEQNLSHINTQIQTLPPMIERLRRVEADINRLQESDADISTRVENRRNNVDQRLDTIHRQVIESATRLEALSRASATNLPGSPGVRQR
tara:strand:- start:17746 stop:18222 length:477 start_codon:yes stop_codon:yes gene_type:complete